MSAPVPQDGVGEGSQGCGGHSMGTLMRGRTQGSPGELESMEDTLGAWKGQADVAGKKTCGRQGTEGGRQLLGHNGDFSWVSADPGSGWGQTLPKWADPAVLLVGEESRCWGPFATG